MSYIVFYSILSLWVVYDCCQIWFVSVNCSYAVDYESIFSLLKSPPSHSLFVSLCVKIGRPLFCPENMIFRKKKIVVETEHMHIIAYLS